MSSLTESDQQIGYMNRQLVQLENELADTKQNMRVESNERLLPRKKWNVCSSGPHAANNLAEAKAYVAFGGRAAKSKRHVYCPSLSILLAVVAVWFWFYPKRMVDCDRWCARWRDWHFLYTQKRISQPMIEIARRWKKSSPRMREASTRWKNLLNDWHVTTGKKKPCKKVIAILKGNSI